MGEGKTVGMTEQDFSKEQVDIDHSQGSLARNLGEVFSRQQNVTGEDFLEETFSKNVNKKIELISRMCFEAKARTTTWLPTYFDVLFKLTL